MTATSWSSDFQAHNHAVEAVITAEEALGSTGPAAPASSWRTGWSRRSRTPSWARTTQIGVPINLHGTPGAIQGPQPLPGAHNHEILGALGYTEHEIAAIAGGWR